MSPTPVALHPPDAEPDVLRSGSGRRADLAAACTGVLLFAVAAAVGAVVQRHSYLLRSPWPPLEARWLPHVGPGTPAAVIVGVLVIGYGPAVAVRLPWRAVPWSAWAASMAWTWSLALIDGWQRGVAGRLATSGEYLPTVPRFARTSTALRDFTHHILIDSPHHWPTHVAGHPPGAILTFVGLDRMGLGGGGWAGTFCITAGGSATAAILVTWRILAGEERARAAAPFVVLTPAAVWVGVSADGYFAAVAAWALALLALATTRSTTWRSTALGLGSGLLLGWAAYLSYGLPLLAIPALAVLLCARIARPLPWVLVGAACVATTFTLAGFDWWEAYGLLHTRYLQGYGGVRPYSYWLWGDLATVVAATGLATVAGLRRVLAGAPGTLRRRRHFEDRERVAAVLLPCAFVLALVAADVSGMSKAETERIWLPFTLWLPVSAALLPSTGRRGWLAAQMSAALLLNHLFLTGW